jgi:hypothetical protein
VNDSKRTTAKPKFNWTVRAGGAMAIKDDSARRMAARKAYRAKIESLLNESNDELLAGVWQRVCPMHIGAAYELPDRRGIIKDLVDLAEVLKPSLTDMKANRLCRLIETYAV